MHPRANKLSSGCPSFSLSWLLLLVFLGLGCPQKSSVPGLSEKVPVVAQTKSSQLYQKHRQQQLLQQQPPPPPGQNPQHAYHYQSHHSGVGISQSKVSPQHSNAGSGSGGSSGMYHPMKEYRSPYAQSVKSSVSQNKVLGPLHVCAPSHTHKHILACTPTETALVVLIA